MTRVGRVKGLGVETGVPIEGETGVKVGVAVTVIAEELTITTGMREQ